MQNFTSEANVDNLITFIESLTLSLRKISFETLGKISNWFIEEDYLRLLVKIYRMIGISKDRWKSAFENLFSVLSYD